MSGTLTPSDRNAPAVLHAEGDQASIDDGNAWTRTLSALTAGDVAEIDRLVRMMLDIDGFGFLRLEFAAGKLKMITIEAGKKF